MPELDIKQANFVSRVVNLTPQILDLLQDVDSFWDEWNANGYATGQANQIEADDLTGANAHLSVQAVNDLMFVLGTISQTVDQAQRATMYRALP